MLSTCPRRCRPGLVDEVDENRLSFSRAHALQTFQDLSWGKRKELKWEIIDFIDFTNLKGSAWQARDLLSIPGGGGGI